MENLKTIAVKDRLIQLEFTDARNGLRVTINDKDASARRFIISDRELSNLIDLYESLWLNDETCAYVLDDFSRKIVSDRAIDYMEEHRIITFDLEDGEDDEN